MGEVPEALNLASISNYSEYLTCVRLPYDRTISRRDEVEICTEDYLNQYIFETKKEEDCVRGYGQKACACTSEYFRSTLAKFGANDKLTNFILQASMNPDVNRSINDHEAIWTKYVNFYGEQDFGIKVEGLTQLFNDVDLKLESDITDLKTSLSSFPACQFMLNWQEKYIPSHPDLGPDDMDQSFPGIIEVSNACKTHPELM